jgi:hypothetical protein
MNTDHGNSPDKEMFLPMLLFCYQFESQDVVTIQGDQGPSRTVKPGGLAKATEKFMKETMRK